MSIAMSFSVYGPIFYGGAIAVFKKSAIGPFYFFFFFFLILSMATFIKCGSGLPKAAFYRCGFKFSPNLHV